MDKVNDLYDQVRNYRIGYTYYWNAKAPFLYKGVIVTGISVGALFYFFKDGNEILFSCDAKSYQENLELPDRTLFGHFYGSSLLDAQLDTETGIRFKINDKAAIEIHRKGYTYLWEIKKFYYDRQVSSYFNRPVSSSRSEFINLLRQHEFTDLQVPSYFTEEVKSKENNDI
ncbi:hypothetical protein [Eubacterium limosum]|uniref:hypothetical protein n=1 Tax=Eubacterium limosum TaxID=1736 RepID=UPI0010636C14|nr:hypothetical protein [Eubacterium limosum]